MSPSTPRQVVVEQGDTLRRVAARVYGDESLWYLLAEENGNHDPDAALEVGRLLTIPNRVVSLSNNATTFKPFGVDNTLVDLSASQLPPAADKKGGCGLVAMIIVIVVMIIFTYFVAAATAGELGAEVGPESSPSLDSRARLPVKR